MRQRLALGVVNEGMKKAYVRKILLRVSHTSFFFVEVGYVRYGAVLCTTSHKGKFHRTYVI